MKRTNKKAAVLLSGGVDSTTALALAVSQHGAENVLVIIGRYGQRHSVEVERAVTVADYYGVQYEFIDLTAIYTNSSSPLLNRNHEMELPTGSYGAQKQHGVVSTYIPYRNGLFLSAAAALAMSLIQKNSRVKIYLYHGIHQDDNGSAYPDTSRAFVKAQAKTINLGSGGVVEIIAPFADKSKRFVVKTGLKLKVPYELTWSCYEGGNIACGKCATCIDRRAAFLANGVKDPVPYAK